MVLATQGNRKDSSKRGRSMAKVLIILLLASTCYGAETIKATGTAKAKIVAQDVFELPTVENLTQDVPYVIVYTEQGATAQVVF